MPQINPNVAPDVVPPRVKTYVHATPTSSIASAAYQMYVIEIPSGNNTTAQAALDYLSQTKGSPLALSVVNQTPQGVVALLAS